MVTTTLYDELFEGDLSEVDEDCPGCQELDYTKISNLFNDIFNRNNIILELDKNVLDTFVELLIFYRMHKTLAELIIIGKLNVEESILPGSVKKIIKNKKRNDKNIRDIFNEEVEQIFGKSFQLNRPKVKRTFKLLTLITVKNGLFLLVLSMLLYTFLKWDIFTQLKN